jgi:hypothetical protein
MLVCGGVSVPLERTTFACAFEYRTNFTFGAPEIDLDIAPTDWKDAQALTQLTQKMRAQPLLSKLDLFVADNSNTLIAVSLTVAVLALVSTVIFAVCFCRARQAKTIEQLVRARTQVAAILPRFRRQKGRLKRIRKSRKLALRILSQHGELETDQDKKAPMVDVFTPANTTLIETGDTKSADGQKNLITVAEFDHRPVPPIYPTLSEPNAAIDTNAHVIQPAPVSFRNSGLDY